MYERIYRCSIYCCPKITILLNHWDKLLCHLHSSTFLFRAEDVRNPSSTKFSLFQMIFENLVYWRFRYPCGLFDFANSKAPVLLDHTVNHTGIFFGSRASKAAWSLSVRHAFSLSRLEVTEPPRYCRVRGTVFSIHLLKLIMNLSMCVVQFQPCPDIKSNIFLRDIHPLTSSNWNNFAANSEPKNANLIKGAALAREVIWAYDRGGEESKVHSAEMWRQKPPATEWRVLRGQVALLFGHSS